MPWHHGVLRAGQQRRRNMGGTNCLFGHLRVRPTTRDLACSTEPGCTPFDVPRSPKAFLSGVAQPATWLSAPGQRSSRECLRSQQPACAGCSAPHARSRLLLDTCRRRPLPPLPAPPLPAACSAHRYNVRIVSAYRHGALEWSGSAPLCDPWFSRQQPAVVAETNSRHEEEASQQSSEQPCSPAVGGRCVCPVAGMALDWRTRERGAGCGGLPCCVGEAVWRGRQAGRLPVPPPEPQWSCAMLSHAESPDISLLSAR